MSRLPEGMAIRLATRDAAEAVAAVLRRAFVTEAEIY